MQTDSTDIFFIVQTWYQGICLATRVFSG